MFECDINVRFIYIFGQTWLEYVADLPRAWVMVRIHIKAKIKDF